MLLEYSMEGNNRILWLKKIKNRFSTGKWWSKPSPGTLPHPRTEWSVGLWPPVALVTPMSPETPVPEKKVDIGQRAKSSGGPLSLLAQPWSLGLLWLSWSLAPTPSHLTFPILCCLGLPGPGKLAYTLSSLETHCAQCFRHTQKTHQGLSPSSET